MSLDSGWILLGLDWTGSIQPTIVYQYRLFKPPLCLRFQLRRKLLIYFIKMSWYAVSTQSFVTFRKMIQRDHRPFNFVVTFISQNCYNEQSPAPARIFRALQTLDNHMGGHRLEKPRGTEKALLDLKQYGNDYKDWMRCETHLFLFMFLPAASYELGFVRCHKIS